jgi:hypothetical protein
MAHNPMVGQINIEQDRFALSQGKRDYFQGIEVLQLKTANQMVNERSKGLWKNSEVSSGKLI